MRIVAPWLYAASAAVLCAIALAFAMGGLSVGIAQGALVAGAAVGALGWWQMRGPAGARRALTGWEVVAILLFALFSLRAFLWIVFYAGNEIQVLSPNNLGDLSLHVTYIRELANGERFWPQNPILTGTQLTYPIGVDLLHSLLFLCGADLWRTFVWMGLIGAALTGVALWRWGGAFTITGFLCNGGLAGMALFFTGTLADYQAPFAWKSVPLALFVTQRGFLFALPAGLLLLCSWRARFFPPEEPAERERAQRDVLPWWGELLLYAALPVFHFHTFLFLSLLLGVWICFVPAIRQAVFTLGAAAFLPATMLTLLITANFSGPEAIGIHPGWMQDAPEFLDWFRQQVGTKAELASQQPPWWSSSVTRPWVPSPVLTIPTFWLLNFGILPLLVFLLVRAQAKDKGALAGKAFVWPAVGIFALCCVVMFARWEWDNVKVMVWSYLVILPPLWHRVIRPWPYSVRVVACVALFGSGFVSLVGGLNDGTNGLAIAKRSELDPLERDLRVLVKHQRFVAHPNYNHPLLLLGQKVTLGYLGHVWSHGYDYQEPQRKVTSILQGAEGWRATAQELGARYLFWGEQEREAYPDSKEPWKTEAKLVASGTWGEIYDLEAEE
jgi:hypothetical protein